MIFNRIPFYILEEEKTALYSYNGTILPALPEWDKEKYPYATLYEGGLYIFGSALCTLVVGEKPCGYDYAPYGSYECFYYDSAGGWGEFRVCYGISNIHQPIWVNYDLYDNSGELYMGASEPIPVYERS